MGTMHSVKEFAEVMKVHPQTVRNWINQGMPALRNGNFIRIDLTTAQDWLYNATVKKLD